MNIKSVDDAIETYVQERIEKGKEKASERFLTYAYMKHGGDEILEFLLKVGGLARYYIYFLKIMENPFKGPEVKWLAVMVMVGLYGCFLIWNDETRTLGIFLLVGALVHAWSLVSMTTKKLRAIDMRIAIYSEIVQIVEKELCGKA
jgi:hypothetical protein